MRKQQELMKEIELRRKMKATVVPTNDSDVRRMLRQLKEPITLFGEREVRLAGEGAAARWLYQS
jgi:U4/U6 small nuclear ribonucleoprotein PRP4